MNWDQITTVTSRPSKSQHGNMEMLVATKNGHQEIAFAWFDDELTFTTAELIGLTIEEARDLKQARDKQYLMS